jgi:1-acyl-sn-glycerol-3-phosphate acyltransferase
MVALRSGLFHIYFALLSVALCVVFLPALLAPWPWTARGVEWWSRGTLWGLGVICGLHYEVRGTQHMRQGPVLYAGKHLAMWDTVILPVLLKDCALVAKRELLIIPFYGWYVRKSGMIAIDRGAGANALRSLVGQAKARLADGRPIAIFPEGTRKAIGAAPDYKPGVAALYGQLGVDCVPFALNSSVYWDGPLRRPGTIVIQFLPAIPPGLKRQAFSALLVQQIETATTALVAEARAAR